MKPSYLFLPFLFRTESSCFRRFLFVICLPVETHLIYGAGRDAEELAVPPKPYSSFPWYWFLFSGTQGMHTPYSAVHQKFFQFSWRALFKQSSRLLTPSFLFPKITQVLPRSWASSPRATLHFQSRGDKVMLKDSARVSPFRALNV